MKQLIFLIISFFIWTNVTACPLAYVDNTPPQLAATTTSICFEQYIVQYDPKQMITLSSAEHLTKQIIQQSKGLVRKDAFHPDTNFKDGATLKDYTNSGFDRGHLTPFADMATTKSDYESFDLINIVPQNKRNNEHIWKNIEISTRSIVNQYGDAYIVTGPIVANNATKLNGRIPIPSYMYKAVYIPSLKQAVVIVTENKDTNDFKLYSVNDFKQLSKYDVFPSLSPSIKATQGTFFKLVTKE